MQKGSLGLHDYNFLGIINDQKQKSSALYFELDGKRATLTLTGVDCLALSDFLQGNIVSTATTVKIAEIAEGLMVRSRDGIVKAFTSSVQEEYFPADAELFFEGITDDFYFTYIDGSYGAKFCAISEGCTIEHSPPLPGIDL